MHQRSIKRIRKSIFPIFWQNVNGQNVSVGVSGTGFFINSDGHFITALHVINDAPANSTLIYLGNVPDKVNAPVPIQEIYRDPVRDIYVGKVDKDGLPALPLVINPPKPGTSICLCGYPLAQLFFDPNGSLNVSSVRQYWQPTYVIDNFSFNKDGKKFDGFLTQNESLPGMSGGPVFNRKGGVCGISLMFFSREIPLPNGGPLIVHNGAAIGIKNIEDIVSKYASNVRKYYFF